MKYSKVAASIYGTAVGDAIGVPVQFKDRGDRKQRPVTDMKGYETFNLPEGSWSDDTSMTLCLADSLAQKNAFDCTDVMEKFGELAFSAEDSFILIHDVSSLTHAHPISLLGCDIYCTVMHQIILGTKKEDLLPKALPYIGSYVRSHNEYAEYIKVYDRLFHIDFKELPEDQINSTGYIVGSLEAALWCFLTTDNFHDCVLKAVNLGNDTDTIGAIAGSIAGAYYQEIPEDWVNKLKKKKLIDKIIKDFEGSL